MRNQESLKQHGDVIWNIANLLRGPYRPPLALVQQHCEDDLAREVLPYRDDAWIDHSKTKVGYEIPFNRHFYEYKPPRDLAAIEQDIEDLERDNVAMLKEIAA